MSSLALFRSRLKRGWKYQYGVIRSIADWTIVVYFIIPALLFLTIRYRSWWIETPGWMEPFPFILIFLFIYLLSWNGSIRLFVEEADKVFLVKKPQLYLGMKKWGYVYSLFQQSMSVAITILILLPFLKNHFLLTWQEIITLTFYFISLKTLMLLVKFYLGKIEKRLIKIVLGILLFIGFSWISQLYYIYWEKGHLFLISMGGLVMMVVSIFYSLKELKKRSSIDFEIDMGRKDKTKNIELIYMLSYEIEKPVITKRTKPLFFRKSKRIFKNRTPVNGHMELFIKVFLRNISYLSNFFQIISVTTIGIVLIPPIWIKVILFIGFLIMMHSWLLLIWDKITQSNPLSKKYSEDEFYFIARKKAVRLSFILAITLLILFVGMWQGVISLFGMPFGLYRR